MSTKKTTFKSITNWLHLWLGLASGIILVIVALTGTLLAFEAELEPIFFNHYHVVKPVGQRLPLDSVITLAQNACAGQKVSRVIVRAEANRSIEVRVGAKGDGSKGVKLVYVNPYNGQILYKGVYTKKFFQQVRGLHRFLLLGDTGKIITGISCAICFFLTISGLVLWWPANKSAMKQRFKIKWNASGKRLNWDLHAVTGFYLSIFLLVVTFTGLVMSYDWLENTILKMADGKMAKEAKVKSPSKGKEIKAGIYQDIIQQTNQIYPGEGFIGITIPPKPSQAITVTKENTNAVIASSDMAYFDAKNGSLLKKVPFEKLTTGAKIRKMITPAHTGSLLGWPGKVLALIVSLFTASLPISGLLIWLGKRRKTKRGKRIARPLQTAV
ncbi:PepSY-associated TM helix domain-containing protein [Mucilaginibacter polytrichastri]|uniref:PepSY domain-containing protein n=1 Tax=Mucilaginibacter polytrichastri TaxID=1302689 RepID=A0A1Q6A0Q5_9SPHI|nr:PepSY-associated TM helix domain-containing protein [Mucilaginibacter polytrichastri]OKS87586.1 hypothetical protein RG47T_3047 [Mucilaginibacter polytrichastri]SFS92501.1 Uncharacterized iron-regulated membrane protein [Mucilaginibacter polytrichastri]